jgi:putative endonuclease
VARNHWTSQGELDLVALDGTTIVFVEVRSTGEDDATRPAESVDAVKQQRLTQAALEFLRGHGLLGHPARFDVITLAWPAGQKDPRITHYPQAFEAVGRWQMFS